MKIKKNLLIITIVTLITISLFGFVLYKPIRSTIVCNQILSIPPSFRYTEGGFRDCMEQIGNSAFFTETYIQIRSTVERNKEAQKYIKEYY